MYHGQISYSIIDRFINNKACEDDKYILEEKYCKPNKPFKVEKEMNDWITIDVYARTKKRVSKMLNEELEFIRYRFRRLKEKEDFQMQKENILQ